ncbi:MAG: hypothetical protein ABSF18_01465 [Gammaproteobacteria bacterium]|jgi:hypothetical protein
MPPTYKTTTSLPAYQALRQSLAQAIAPILMLPIDFSMVTMPNVGKVLAITNPRLPLVETGPAVQDPELSDAKEFLAFLNIKFIDLNEIVKIFYKDIVQFFNDKKPEILFTAIPDKNNNFHIVPTQYFYDHQSEMVALLNQELMDVFEKYILNYQASIGSLTIFLDSLKESMVEKIEDFDRCTLKNMSLLEFFKYNPQSPIDAFNYFLKTNNDYSPFVIVSEHEKIFHLPREKNNELMGQYLINIRNLVLKTESELRKKMMQEDDFTGNKGIFAQMQKIHDLTVKVVIHNSCCFDKNEMKQAVLNAEKFVKEYHLLLQQCADEGFSKHDLATIDINTHQKHIDVLMEALKVKLTFLGRNALSLSWLMLRSEAGKLTLDARNTLVFAEINKLLNETKAALKYLGESKLSRVCENTKLSLQAYIEKRDKEEYEKQQQAIVAKANLEAKQEKEKARASASSSSSSSSIESTTPQFKGSFAQPTLSTSDENVHYLGKSMGVDIYLNFNPTNFIDEIPDVSVFTGDSLFKIADQSSGSGTKRLNLDPPVMLNCQVDGENKALPITFEMKPNGTPQRLLCVHLPYKGAVMVIPVIYKKDGLHEKNDIEALRTSCKTKVHVLHLSTKANDAKPSLRLS